MVRKNIIFSVVCLVFLNACGNSEEVEARRSDGEPQLENLAPAGWSDETSAFVGRDGAKIGTVAFKNTPGAGVLIRLDLSGLNQGWHGAHLHQVGDCSDFSVGFKAAGGHVNPDQNDHGLLNESGFERADLPNIYAGADGRATAEIYNDAIALYPSEQAAADGGPFALLDEDGFAIVVHENADDHVTQPIGGTGARVACAAIRGSG